MSEGWICPKCGSKKLTKPEVFRLQTRFGMFVVPVIAYICDNCGYVELYKEALYKEK